MLFGTGLSDGVPVPPLISFPMSGEVLGDGLGFIDGRIDGCSDGRAASVGIGLEVIIPSSIIPHPERAAIIMPEIIRLIKTFFIIYPPV